jgi:hypothetical protein
VDPHADGNTFSFYYRSRLDIGLPDGGRFTCEDMRSGCPGMVSGDGGPADYSYVKVDTAPDGPGRPGAPQGTGIYGSG